MKSYSDLKKRWVMKKKKKKKKTTRLLCVDKHYRHFYKYVFGIYGCSHCGTYTTKKALKEHCCSDRIEEYSKAKQFEIWRKHGKANQS
jgi:hypothetical protein